MGRFSLLDNQDRFGNAYYPAVDETSILEKEIWDELLRHLQRGVTTKSADATLTDSEYVILVDASAAVRTITLPPIANGANNRFVIKKIDSSVNKVTYRVDQATDLGAGVTIDGQASRDILLQYDMVVLDTNGTQWYIVG